MSLFRLKCEVRGYLNFEVIAETPEDVMLKFGAAIYRKAQKAGWNAEEAQAEIDRIKPEWIEEVTPGVWIDFEPDYGA